MLSWPAKSPYLSPIGHLQDITGRQLRHHPQPALASQVTRVPIENHKIFAQIMVEHLRVLQLQKDKPDGSVYEGAVQTDTRPVERNRVNDDSSDHITFFHTLYFQIL
ncbi:hypothetical protein TNCV_2728681 [Trichonephila clavipes]|nr:hypothetical protein TNCV_2728681 [Trichonephila clavipes]